jgi:hypothetical protein
VYFLLHFPEPFGRWALPTTLSCGARTFLQPTLNRHTTNATATRPAAAQLALRPLSNSNVKRAASQRFARQDGERGASAP